MKNAITIGTIWLACWQLVLGQIAIDSFKVFDGGYPRVDSIYLSWLHQGQDLKSIYIGPFNDACATTYIYVTFDGCRSTAPTRLDTMLTLGYATRQVYMRIKWDTSAACPMPIVPVYTDSLLWQTCYPVSVSILPNDIVTCYPNPADDVVSLDVPLGKQIQEIMLCTLDG